ncbi:MAG: di-heme oxidoredictase family protein [Blastocatellia bacterium]
MQRSDRYPSPVPRAANYNVKDLEDTGGTFGKDVELFADFIRALAAPPRLMPANSAGRAEVDRGFDLFKRIGCGTCHLPEMVTARTGALVNGGAFRVPAALGNKKFHPYSDFLLHDIGTTGAIGRR